MNQNLKQNSEIDLNAAWEISIQSTNHFAEIGIKYCIILNGSACVAVLAFLGSIANQKFYKSIVSMISWSLMCFCFGCLVSVICCFCRERAFFQNSIYLEKKIKNIDDKKSINEAIKHRDVGVICVLLAIIAFVSGCILFHYALIQ